MWQSSDTCLGLAFVDECVCVCASECGCVRFNLSCQVKNDSDPICHKLRDPISWNCLLFFSLVRLLFHFQTPTFERKTKKQRKNNTKTRQKAALATGSCINLAPNDPLSFSDFAFPFFYFPSISRGSVPLIAQSLRHPLPSINHPLTLPPSLHFSNRLSCDSVNLTRRVGLKPLCQTLRREVKDDNRYRRVSVTQHWCNKDQEPPFVFWHWNCEKKGEEGGVIPITSKNSKRFVQRFAFLQNVKVVIFRRPPKCQFSISLSGCHLWAKQKKGNRN